MARHRQDHLREVPPEEPAVVVHRLAFLLDAGRVLMLLGWGTLAASAVSSTTWNRPPDDDAANATRAFVGYLLWLVGVCLVTVVTPASRRGRLPLVAWRGSAVRNLVVVGCFFFPLWN
ncbi:hypothetical protein HU200_059182 [Digitaria exilis]|uniref:Uncharacterized protein n=1 Tax=Digitaria exilis TaxID=1010633 RepID=A0A835E1I0_9POAL|nr:hypothetical protein HU200_059182 [Digitaria exilis]